MFHNAKNFPYAYEKATTPNGEALMRNPKPEDFCPGLFYCKILKQRYHIFSSFPILKPYQKGV